MTSFLKSPFYVFVLTALIFANMPQAQAQQRDFCNDYANEMISIDQRGKQAKCVNWRNHSNYDAHYQWCGQQSPQHINQILSNWRSQLQTCQFAGSGSPAAQGQQNPGQQNPNQPGRIVVTSKTLNKIPPFQIDQIFENGKWTRCAAEMKNIDGHILRIQINKANNEATITSPIPNNLGNQFAMTLYLGPHKAYKLNGTKIPAGATGFRARAIISSEHLGKISAADNIISVTIGQTEYVWYIAPLKNMENVLLSLESCAT